MCSLDLWDRFEHSLVKGVSAIQFWSDQEPDLRNTDDLVNLLLIEFEYRGAEEGSIAEFVRSLKPRASHLDATAEFVRGAYDIMIENGRRPCIDLIDGLTHHEQKCLRKLTDPFHLGQLVVDRYRVKQRIGHGSFGVVYKLHDQLLNETVACKAAHQTADSKMSRLRRRQLTMEWIAMDRLAGTRCPKVFQLSTHGDVAFLTMEFIEGQSLRERIRRAPLTPKSASGILADVADTVAYAHYQHQVIHRDLKPENVLIDHSGKVFVVDFGLVGSFAFTRNAKSIEMLAGTRGYMAPEMLESSRQRIDGRSDIYAIGVMLHELLTCEKPPAIDEGWRLADYAWPASIPRQLSRIGMKCLKRNPDDRYDDAYKLAADLRNVAGTLS